MVRYPEVYQKAQSEIDLVIGNGRLPSLDDRHSLPYLECILKEVYRPVDCPRPAPSIADVAATRADGARRCH